MTTAQQTMKRKLAEADASPSPKVIKTKTSKRKVAVERSDEEGEI